MPDKEKEVEIKEGSVPRESPPEPPAELEEMKKGSVPRESPPVLPPKKKG